MHQPGLSADLDSFDLLDLVQVIQMTRRDLALVVRAGSQALGVLRFSQGDLLWAEFGALRGEEAFMALAALHSGSVEEVAWDGHEERNVNHPLSRLVMQAVEYRETHENHQPPVAQANDLYKRPVQTGSPLQSPLKPREHFNGSDNSLRLGNMSPATSALPEEEAAPSWVQKIHSAAETFSAQPTTAMPPVATAIPASPPPQLPASFYSVQTEPLSPPRNEPTQPGSSSLFKEEMDVQLPEPMIPFSSLNGKFTLPSLTNGNRASPIPLSAPPPPDDPPTVPLPSVQGGFRDYAAKRNSPLSEVQRESGPEVQRLMDSVTDQAVMVRSAPASAVLPSSVPTLEPLPTPPLSAAPSAEPKLSSLSILEQLAYGGLGNNSRAEAAMLDAGGPTLFVDESPESTPVAPPIEPPPVQRAPSRLLDDASAGQNGGLPALNSLQSPSLASLSAEGTQHLQKALETFAAQVGASCIATAVIRTDGMLLAEYKVRRGQEQDLGSPAYHMAYVMQSSLRALLMGGWGDLEDTIITGSTHSVVLRRLGRAEKEVFHVAVLERSGNPGLCRVRMRNNEAALLQAL